MWAPITVKQQMLPTSQRNSCPHQTESGAHIEWNRLPTSTGIRKDEEQLANQGAEAAEKCMAILKKNGVQPKK
jgi:hypothetical protein